MLQDLTPEVSSNKRDAIRDALHGTINSTMTLEQDNVSLGNLQNTLRMQALFPLGGYYFLSLVQTASTTVEAKLLKVNTGTDEVDIEDSESITSIGEAIYWAVNPQNPLQYAIGCTNGKLALITADLGADTITVSKETTNRFTSNGGMKESGSALLFHNGGLVGVTGYDDASDFKCEATWFTISGTTLNYEDVAVSPSCNGGLTASWRGCDVVYDETESAYVTYIMADTDIGAFKFTIASDTISFIARATEVQSSDGTGRFTAKQGYGVYEYFNSTNWNQSISFPDFSLGGVSTGSMVVEDSSQTDFLGGQGSNFMSHKEIHATNGLSFVGQDPNYPLRAVTSTTSGDPIEIIDAKNGYYIGDGTSAFGTTNYQTNFPLFTEELDYMILRKQYSLSSYTVYPALWKL